MDLKSTDQEWNFVEKKNKGKFDIKYWISDLLFKIENDKFSINDLISTSSK